MQKLAFSLFALEVDDEAEYETSSSDEDSVVRPLVVEKLQIQHEVLPSNLAAAQDQSNKPEIGQPHRDITAASDQPRKQADSTPQPPLSDWLDAEKPASRTAADAEAALAARLAEEAAAELALVQELAQQGADAEFTPAKSGRPSSAVSPPPPLSDWLGAEKAGDNSLEAKLRATMRFNAEEELREGRERAMTEKAEQLEGMAWEHHRLKAELARENRAQLELRRQVLALQQELAAERQLRGEFQPATADSASAAARIPAQAAAVAMDSDEATHAALRASAPAQVIAMAMDSDDEDGDSGGDDGGDDWYGSGGDDHWHGTSADISGHTAHTDDSDLGLEACYEALSPDPSDGIPKRPSLVEPNGFSLAVSSMPGQRVPRLSASDAADLTTRLKERMILAERGPTVTVA